MLTVEKILNEEIYKLGLPKLYIAEVIKGDNFSNEIFIKKFVKAYKLHLEYMNCNCSESDERKKSHREFDAAWYSFTEHIRFTMT